MSVPLHISPVAKRLAAFLVGLTFCLLMAGGVVHSTGSSLACPDWPLCYGTVFPKMTGGVEFEHTHRLIAGSVAVLTTLLAYVLWRQRRNNTPYRLAFAAVGLVLFQAVLGGLTVIYKLPTMISTAHLATSMIFFSIMIVLAIHLYRGDLLGTENSSDMLEQLRPARRWILAGGAMVYAQIVLGALVRHTGSGSVCTTIPLCEGSIWPAHAHPTIQLHMAHRLMGAGVAVFLTIVAAKVMRATTTFAATRLGLLLRMLSMTLPILVLLQIGLGIVSVVTLLAIVPITAHLALGALLLGICVALSCLTLRISPSSAPSGQMMRDLASLAKFRLTSLVLLVATVGYFVSPAGSVWPLSRFLFFITGTGLLVLGAAFFNAYLERDSDARMHRTHDRPLAAKRLNEKPIPMAGAFFGLAGVTLLTFEVNPLTGFLGAIAFVSYAFMYTPLKAQTSFAALVGAVPGALPPLLGWTAATNEIGYVGATLFFILFLWQMPHFFAIAFYRLEEYRQAGTQVMPLAQGEALTKKLMARYAAMLVPVTLFLVPLGIAGRIYFAVALALGLTYLGWTAYGFFCHATRRWARGLFVFSLVYLPVLFLALLLDSRIP